MRQDDPPDDLPDVPEYLILQICQEWANDPPAWLREKADDYWLQKWEQDHLPRSV